MTQEDTLGRVADVQLNVGSTNLGGVGPRCANVIKAEPIQVQLDWLEMVRRLYGRDAAREAYKETVLPVTLSMRINT